MENESEKNVVEEKVVASAPQETEKKKCCLGICKKMNCKKPGIIIAVIVLLVLIAGSYGYKVYRQKVDVGQKVVKERIEKFVSENVPAGTKTEIKEVTKEGDLYKVLISVDKQEIPVYVTRDGKKLIQNLVDLDQKAQDPKQAAAPEQTEAQQKAEIPTVDLFVMSYCPYGLQMERGILPVVEALGNKIKFNLKFVSYTLHGQKEVDENVNQYCIGKTQPAKLDNYLKCFWKDSKGVSDACMKTAGINTAQVKSCVAETNAKFNPTEKAFDIDKEENVKFGVQGSPTLVVNGTTISSGRDSASIMKAVCSGFANQPKECSAKLSATSPVAGFDDQAAAAGGSASGAATAAGACH